MLLLTDRGGPAYRLGRDLSLVKPCRVANLAEDAGKPIFHDLLVYDVDIASGDKSQMLIDSLARHRGPKSKVLFIVKGGNRDITSRAYALGATSVVRSDIPRSVLLDSVAQLISQPPVGGQRAGPQELAAWKGTVRAGMVLADILDSAQDGTPISYKNVMEGSEAVLSAIEESTIQSWVDIVWSHDDITYQHCLLVAGLVAAFSISLGFRYADRCMLSQAALLHDVGKAMIPTDILNKPAKLNLEELEIVQQHPKLGAEMLVKQGEFSKEIIDVVRHHHEMLDGSGYPDTLMAAEICDVVRLTTICDIYAALIERRSYKASISPSQAFRIMERMEGKLDFDFLKAFRGVVAGLEGSSAAREHSPPLETL